MLFLSHNSGSRYARRSIKGFKDADDNLVSTKNLIQKLACCVGAQGQVNLAKKTKTCPHCDVITSPIENLKPKSKKNFKSKLVHLLNP